jgi:hypothetical protein
MKHQLAVEQKAEIVRRQAVLAQRRNTERELPNILSERVCVLVRLEE